MTPDKKSLLAFAKQQREQFESTLREFVETPSVSSEPERQPDIRRMAELAAKTTGECGGEAAILETDGNPLVYGRFDVDENAPTLTIYNHLDVQPASRATEPWK